MVFRCGNEVARRRSLNLDAISATSKSTTLSGVETTTTTTTKTITLTTTTSTDYKAVGTSTTNGDESKSTTLHTPTVRTNNSITLF